MKKHIGMALVCAIAVSVCACTNADSTTRVIETEKTTMQENDTKQDATEITVEATSSVNAAITEQIISDLFKDNLTCMYDIFVLNVLQFDREMKLSETVCAVTSNEFASYEELDSYIRNIYCKEKADYMMLHWGYDNQPMYINHDGKLYIDTKYIGGKGYYVDWSDFKVTMESVEADKCEFTIHGKVEWPAEKPVLEDYEAKGTAIYEDGKWVLTEIVS